MHQLFSGYRGALRNPQFSLLLFGRSLSSVAYALFSIQGVWMVMTQSNNSPWFVSAFAIAATIPFVVFGLVAGIGADRWNKRRVMTVAEGVGAIVCLAVFAALAKGGASPWILVGANAVLATVGAFAEPCYRSVLPWVVEESDLNASNALLDGFQRGADIVVPLMVGVFAAFLRPDHLFVAAGVCYVVSALSYGAMRNDGDLAAGLTVESAGKEAPRIGAPNEGKGLLSSYRFLASHPAILLIVLCSAANILINTGAWRIGLPLLAREGLGKDMGFYGTVLGSMSAAQLVVTLVFGALKPSRPLLVYVVGVMVWGAALATVGLVREPGFVIAAAVVLAAAQSIQGLTRSLSIQRHIPRGQLGRVFSFAGTLNYTADTVSLPLATLLVGLLGAGGLIATAGGCIFTFGMLLFMFRVPFRSQ